MRRMFSEEQLERVAQEQAILVSIEKIQEMAVRKMSAPESTTLTDEQITQIIGGVFINGEFLGSNNPVLCPPREYESNYAGLMITGTGIFAYQIVKSTKVISVYSASSKVLQLAGIGYFNGKNLPTYPSDSGTFTLKCVDGVLTWAEDV